MARTFGIVGVMLLALSLPQQARAMPPKPEQHHQKNNPPAPVPKAPGLNPKEAAPKAHATAHKVAAPKAHAPAPKVPPTATRVAAPKAPAAPTKEDKNKAPPLAPKAQAPKAPAPAAKAPGSAPKAPPLTDQAPPLASKTLNAKAPSPAAKAPPPVAKAAAPKHPASAPKGAAPKAHAPAPKAAAPKPPAPAHKAAVPKALAPSHKDPAGKPPAPAPKAPEQAPKGRAPALKPPAPAPKAPAPAHRPPAPAPKAPAPAHRPPAPAPKAPAPAHRPPAPAPKAPAPVPKKKGHMKMQRGACRGMRLGDKCEFSDELASEQHVRTRRLMDHPHKFHGRCWKGTDDDESWCKLGACPDGSWTCGDPHMQGLRGQHIDWSGVDGGWYCLVKDEDADLHVNVRVTAPLPREFPNRQLITGMSVISDGNSLVVEVKDPYTTLTSGCSGGNDSVCLADGGLRATVNGQEAGHLLVSNRDAPAADGIYVSSSNLPVECRQFGGDKIWARMHEEMIQGMRQLKSETFEDWILSFDQMAAPDWCRKYIAEHGISEVRSTHAIIKIMTRTIDARLSVGFGYQTYGEINWDGRILPDLEFWQMDVGLDGLDIDNPSLSGILGETAHPVVSEDGHDVMEGDGAFRGSVEDYRVPGPLGTNFVLHA